MTRLFYLPISELNRSKLSNLIKDSCNKPSGLIPWTCGCLNPLGVNETRNRVKGHATLRKEVKKPSNPRDTP